MQALGPPEKEARTTGHGLIFSSYIPNIKEGNYELTLSYYSNLQKLKHKLSTIALHVKEEYG